MSQERLVNDRKLIKLLRKLSKPELKQCRMYVHSPFFNRNEQIIALFELLLHYAPKFTKPITMAMLFVGIFPKRPRNSFNKKDDQRLRHLMSNLSELVQDFLVHKKYQEQKIRNRQLLAIVFQERNLDEFVPAILRDTQKQQEQQAYRDTEFYYNQYLLEERMIGYHMRANNRSMDIGFQQVIDNFRFYYIGTLIRYYCAAINRERILNVRYSYPLLNQLLAHIETNHQFHVPLICIYYYILKLLRDEDTEIYYPKVVEMLAVEEKLFPISELRQMYSFVLNFCSSQIKKGKDEYARRRFEIYLHLLASDILTADMAFSAHHFILIVKTAVSIGELEWAENFMATYKGQLQDSYRSSIISLSNAYLAFARKDYSEAHNHLAETGTPEDFFYNFYYRVLMIQILYDDIPRQGSSERQKKHLHDMIEALRHYIRRCEDRQMSQYILSTYDHFKNFIRRLYHIKYEQLPEEVNPKILDKIREEIHTSVPLEERAWLLEKADQLSVVSEQ